MITLFVVRKEVNVLYRFVLFLLFLFYASSGIAGIPYVATVREEKIDEIDQSADNILCLSTEPEKCFRCKSGSEFYVNPGEYVYFFQNEKILVYECKHKGRTEKSDNNFQFVEGVLGPCTSKCEEKVLDYAQYEKYGLCIKKGAFWTPYKDPVLRDSWMDARKRHDIVFATAPLCYDETIRQEKSKSELINENVETDKKQSAGQGITGQDIDIDGLSPQPQSRVTVNKKNDGDPENLQEEKFVEEADKENLETELLVLTSEEEQGLIREIEEIVADAISKVESNCTLNEDVCKNLIDQLKEMETDAIASIGLSAS